MRSQHKQTCKDKTHGVIFSFTESSYSPANRHHHTDDLSPAKFEKAYFSRPGSVEQNEGKPQPAAHVSIFGRTMMNIGGGKS